MINIPPLIRTPTFDPKLVPQLIKTWQLGQIISSRAQTSSNAEGELKIQVGQHLLDARSQAPIKAGDELQLKVSELGDVPVLKILNSSRPENSLTIYLRQAVPQPASLQAVIRLLESISPQLNKLPELAALKTALENISMVQPATNPTDKSAPPLPGQQLELARQVEQFLKNSGFNFESSMARGVVPVKDMKLQFQQVQFALNATLNPLSESAPASFKQLAGLNFNNLSPQAIVYLLTNTLSAAEKAVLSQSLALSTQIDTKLFPEPIHKLLQFINLMPVAQKNEIQQWMQLLPALFELKQQVEQGLKTITHNQLQFLQASSDSAFILLFNLLVAKNPEWIDLFNIKINKEEKNSQSENHWGVTVQFEFPEMGLVEARLTLMESQLHTRLTAESKQCHQLMSENIGLLESALDNAGFNVAGVSCQHEKITRIHHIHHLRGPLLDDRA